MEWQALSEMQRRLHPGKSKVMVLVLDTLLPRAGNYRGDSIVKWLNNISILGFCIQ